MSSGDWEFAELGVTPWLVIVSLLGNMTLGNTATLVLFTPGQRISQCKKNVPSSFSAYFTPVVHTNDDPLCQNLKLWGNFDFFTFLI